MSKRHYTATPTGFKCVSCREEFASKALLSTHYSIGGKCRHPLTIGLTIDLSKNTHHWTRPENVAIRLSKAA